MNAFFVFTLSSINATIVAGEVLPLEWQPPAFAHGMSAGLGLALVVTATLGAIERWTVHRRIRTARKTATRPLKLLPVKQTRKSSLPG